MAKPLRRNLTAQVLISVVVGAAIGYFHPAWGKALQPVSDAFISLVKMIVGPIIFLTIVVGIAKMGDLKKVGRVGGKALVYFEVVTTLAMMIGLAVANTARPGEGVTTSAVHEDVSDYAKKAQEQSILKMLIPDSAVGAFAAGNPLQILFVSVLVGVAVAGMGERSAGLIAGLERLTEVMFRVVGLIMLVAPLGALAAMGVTVGKYGILSLLPLARLMACVYGTMALFIFVVLELICRAAGVSLWRYLAFIREEILLVLGTSSSETALPRMIVKLELLGCSRRVVGLVIPAGYSFNLDGTSIYLTMAVLFIAQAYGIHLSIGQQAYLLGVLLLTSKGAAAVTGAGFITLAATLESTGVLPVAGLALLVGVDRFMSEARAITNLIGNGVATIVVSKWEGEFDESRYQTAISGGAPSAPS